MRKKIIAGNWKMFGPRDEAQALLQAILAGITSIDKAIETIVFPSFIYLPLAQTLLSGTRMAWGAQNFYMGQSGAFTGEVSAPMLLEYGCRYGLVGHSERRQLFHEDLVLVAAKFKSALEFGLIPLLCVGETLSQREQGKTDDIIQEQLLTVVEAVGIQAFAQTVIAYEPVWAIGTGLTATPEQAQAVHYFIRQKLAQYDLEVANTVRILYGGSVKPDNAPGLFSMPDIDGGLVGGASLNAQSFLQICGAINQNEVV